MVIRVVNQTVIRKHDTLCTPGTAIQCADVTFCVVPAAFLGENSFVVAKPVSSDAHAGYDQVQCIVFPTLLSGFTFRHKVFGQLVVKMNVKSDFLLCIVCSFRIQVGDGFCWCGFSCFSSLSGAIDFYGGDGGFGRSICLREFIQKAERGQKDENEQGRNNWQFLFHNASDVCGMMPLYNEFYGNTSGFYMENWFPYLKSLSKICLIIFDWLFVSTVLLCYNLF